MRLGSFYYGVWSTFGNVSVCSALFWLWFLVYEVIILCHLSSSQRLAESFPMLNFFRLDYTRSPTRWTFFSTGLSSTCPTHCSCAIFLVVVFTSQRLVINLLRLYAFYPDLTCSLWKLLCPEFAGKSAGV